MAHEILILINDDGLIKNNGAPHIDRKYVLIDSKV